jgi:hypothetical protein
MMDREAREALGITEDSGSNNNGGAVEIQYTYPQKPMHFAVLGILIFYLASYTAGRKGMLKPGFWFYDYVMMYFPFGRAQGYIWFQEKLFWSVIGLHFAEACWMGAKLAKQGVPMGGKVWLEWFFSTFIEGIGAHDRFNELVARKQKQAQKKSH